MLIVRHYIDYTNYNTQLTGLLMYTKTPTGFELIARHQGILHMMSYIIMISNIHVDC
jgi:hypothetical protein